MLCVCDEGGMSILEHESHTHMHPQINTVYDKLDIYITFTEK